ncbi:MAG: hypothetical protein FWH47_07900, partial [Methanomassiliicoccaceae archaeon]|nr:hypothetical protein [Methanomassiliicoccaceae archaeon]
IGLAAAVSPVVCRYADSRFEVLSMLAAVTIITIMALTGAFGYVEGALLLAALCVFIFLAYRVKSKAAGPGGPWAVETIVCNAPCIKRSSALVVIGIVLLYVGARAFIGGASELAESLGVSQLMVGLVVVAVGVSLPELCICIVAAYRGENEILVSNIIGSIVFNCFFALGLGVFFTTVDVTHYTLAFHMPVMILMAALLALFIWRRNGIPRLGGAALVCIYIVYVALMILFPELTQGLV